LDRIHYHHHGLPWGTSKHHETTSMLEGNG
jgi:hypothetical protein